MRTAKTKLLALLLSVCMLASLLAAPVSAAQYDDVPEWAAKHVDRWTEAGVMEGSGNGSFDPTHKLTRAEFAVILCRLMGYTAKSDSSVFTDLPDDQAAADALLKLHAAGVMQGVGNNKADPDGTLTREHVAVMMFRALNMKANPNSAPMSFADADQVSDWAKVEMSTMSALKLIEGVGNNMLAPKNDIPKQDMAALLSKMVAVYVTENGATVDVANDEDVVNPNGAVIILAKDVKIADAADSGSIVVAPGAPANAAVTVTGEAGSITVAAAGTKLNLSKGAKVDSVTVAEGADKTAVTAEAGARVDSVTTSAKDVKVNGAEDAVGSVTADKGSAEVKAKGAKVEVGEADVKVDGKAVNKNSAAVSAQDGTAAVSTGGSGSSGGGSRPSASTGSVSLSASETAETSSTVVPVDAVITASISNPNSAEVVWLIGGVKTEVTGNSYTVTASDMGKEIQVKLVRNEKDEAVSNVYTVENIRRSGY